jgi:heat shock 70kDa protein 1/2/6/8
MTKLYQAAGGAPGGMPGGMPEGMPEGMAGDMPNAGPTPESMASENVSVEEVD